MARYDELSSTERLLDLIRGKSIKGSDSPGFITSSSSAGGLKRSFLKAFPFKKKIVVGVDIGDKHLRLVKIGPSADKKPELLDYSHIPFDSSIPKQSPRFLRFFKSALAGFCDALETFEIWSTISSANVETRYLRIPKVPKKQISTTVYWTYKKDISFNDQNEVFDYSVLGDIIEEGVPKMEVMAYSVTRQAINELKNIFTKSGYPLTGISTVPFALQNLFRTQWLKDGKNVCSLYVGNNWSRIAIFSKGNLILSREIKAGIKSMIEAVREEIDTNQPDRFPPQDSRDEIALLENYNDDNDLGTDQAQKLLFGFIDNTLPSIEEGEALDIDSEKMFSMILPALDRVIRQVEKTIRHYSLQFGDEGVGKLFITGEISTNRRMVDYIGDQLELPVESIDPFVSGSFLSSDVSVPDSESERGTFVPAVGIALSSNVHTPNFILTYKDRERLALNIQIKRLVFGAFLLLMAMCIGFSFWQSRMLDQKKTSVVQLERLLEKYSPIVDQNLIISMVTKAQRNIDTAEAFVKKYLAMAVINEITRITPSDIRLSNITAELGWPEGYRPSGTTGSGPKKSFKIEGVIYGDRLTFEAALAGYLVKLKRSPMFGKPVIKKRDYGFIEDQEVLQFTAELELI